MPAVFILMSIKNTNQLKALIKNQARKKQTNPHWLLTYYMMERFLKRISLSCYQNNFVLKGGILISILLDLSRRSSSDLDLGVNGFELTSASLAKILQEIMEIDAKDSIHFELKDLSPIRLQTDKPCYRAKVLAGFERMQILFSIDMTSGDVITPKAIPYDLHPLLDSGRIRIQGYPAESILSEKIEAILSDNGKGRRIRDFYDIYALSTLQPNYVGKTLLKAICNTFKHRNSLALLDNLPERLERIRKSKDLEKQWENYQEKNDYAKGIPFARCCDALENILREVLPGKFI